MPGFSFPKQGSLLWSISRVQANVHCLYKPALIASVILTRRAAALSNPLDLPFNLRYLTETKFVTTLTVLSQPNKSIN
jgi:hypothetical protein